MATVNWSGRAIAQIAEIAAYIGQFDPAAARRMAERLIRAGDSLSSFPNRGRPADGGRRELPGIAPYVIRYRVEGERVLILSIRHGAQRPD
jgi:plasmid stabilization system protein ParE